MTLRKCTTVHIEVVSFLSERGSDIIRIKESDLALVHFHFKFPNNSVQGTKSKVGEREMKYLFAIEDIESKSFTATLLRDLWV